MLTLHPITPKIGAVATGVDLTCLDEQAFAAIQAAFAKHHVLVFPDQALSREQHKAFGRRFGDLHLHPAKVHLGQPGDPEIFDIEITERTRVANGELWHSDLTCEPVPPFASALYLKALPPSGGGDTMFANMAAAFDGLSPAMQTLLLGLTAFNDGRKDLAGYGYQLKAGETYPAAHHPVVIAHPITGRATLFINEPFTVQINELHRRESDALLTMLHRYVEASPRFQCRIAWQPNMLVLWDNRATQHHAVWDYFPERRVGERVTVQASSAPVAFHESAQARVALRRDQDG